MTLDQLVIWIIVGGVAGFLADLAVSGTKLSILESIVVGILGAFVGGWVFAQLGAFPGGGILGQILTAFVGAVILLVLLVAVNRRR